ncbi:MAG: Clp protease ClpP, partial [Pseudomonadales bacterium]|nr:Clp protease ClpP [Pseudomonadales bacterium]
MSLMKDKLPQIHAVSRAKAYKWDAPADILNEYSRIEPPKAAADGNVIDVLDVIGEDFWGEGVTAKAVGDRLKGMAGSVKVRINSPGGDMFEGLAIYNMLRAHSGSVEVEILGLAASAASIIAMAGDEIVMGPGSIMMIHNAWGMVIGNRHDMREAADVFETFDSSMVKLYAARTGRERDDIAKMMDDETFLDAEEAVEAGFATKVDGDIAAADTS